MVSLWAQCACNGPATVLRVGASGNIQSQTQYSYGNGPQSTALNIIKATSDGGAIFAGQPQSGCPAQNLQACGEIVKVDSTGKVQWANDLLFATSPSSPPPKTWPFDVQQTTDGGFVLVGYATAPGSILQSVDCQIELHRAITVDAPIRRPEQLLQLSLLSPADSRRRLPCRGRGDLHCHVPLTRNPRSPSSSLTRQERWSGSTTTRPEKTPTSNP